MKIENGRYVLELDDKNGNLTSYRSAAGVEYLSDFGREPLFTLRLMDETGARLDVKSDFCCQMCAARGAGEWTLSFSRVGGLDLDATVRIGFDDSAFVTWNLRVENRTGYSVEWEQFPGMLLEHKLPTHRGKHKLFLPLFEGVEIEDWSLRKKYFESFEPGYPSKGWEGCYPGPVAVQFLALYDGREGLYLGMHDETLQSKYIDAEQVWNGLKPSTRFLPGTDSAVIEMPFHTVTGFFAGGFYEAAEIYRNFAEHSRLVPDPLPQTTWLEDPPVVVMVSVRGEKDTGDVSPNCYYPYPAALPHLDRLRARIHSRLLVLLCHWEGSAPWCPPYVWPPFGDRKAFDEFVRGVHERGDLFGLYCSGIGWTQKSMLTDYNREGELSERELRQTMCLAPDQSLPYALICNGSIRWGYEMCPATENARKIMRGEVEKLAAESGADYIQLFDQNLGGNSSCCYAADHGHPRTPGVWQTKAMRELIGELQPEGIFLGCEAAASEGFHDLLPFNDGRNYMGFTIGTPVPAYAYVYHERRANFMGNQITTTTYLRASENPDNLLYRLGHLFAQGDALMVVLKNDGKINWDWGTPWPEPDPEQEPVLDLLATLVAWRKGNLRAELTHGRMEKPLEIACGDYEIVQKDGRKMHYPSVVTRAWRANGIRSQIFVNPFGAQTVRFSQKVKGVLVRDPAGAGEPFEADVLEICARSVAKLEFPE